MVKVLDTVEVSDMQQNGKRAFIDTRTDGRLYLCCYGASRTLAVARSEESTERRDTEMGVVHYCGRA